MLMKFSLFTSHRHWEIRVLPSLITLIYKWPGIWQKIYNSKKYKRNEYNQKIFKCKYSKKSEVSVPETAENMLKRAGKTEALWKPNIHFKEQENIA